ncbi:hypothetical protein [Parasitella parasitica]|uniref:Endothelin-converting enzyme 1 n=1 Tax=Parasitella parasitica TaxID=35722 RepID=A0A0B7N6I0_9FUNG|nr:hypothetical protein [Parasitella parasitica]
MAGGILPNSLSAHSAHLLAQSYGVGTCETQACKETAYSILHDLDLNADPCSDFYQYTCGNWIKDHKIPDSESSVGSFNNLKNANVDGLAAMLEGSYEDLLQGIPNRDSSFLDNAQIDKDRENFNKVKAYYRSCMDEDTINRLGPTPIYPEVSKLLAKLGFNEEFTDTRFTSDHVRQFTETLIHLGTEGVDNLFSFGVGADDQSPDENVIAIDQPSLGLPSREYYEQPEVIAAYRAGLTSLLDAVLGEPKGTTEMDNLRREKMKENNLQMLGDVDIEYMVDRFIEFESHLAKLTLPNDQLQNPIDLYNPMSIAQLLQNYPIADWIQLFRHFTPNEASLPERVIVTVPRFMQDLTDWLINSAARDDGATTQSIREYFIIKTILANIGNVDKDTREIYRSMNSKISSGTTAPPKRSRVCLSATSNTFGQLLGRFFVLKNFGGEPQREQVASFIDNIQITWSERLDQIDWLDAETRAKAIEKVKKIKHKEAYSTLTPDVRSADSLANYYSDINIDVLNFYANQKSAILWDNKKSWSQIGQKVDKSVWHMDPHEVNAYYSPVFNEVVIPAGILQSPFYHSELPNYLNYGGIGVVIGHEFTHAFDNSGRLYDGDGKLNAWWSDATTEAFEARSQCFNDQYSSFFIEGPNKTTYHVNGKMTLGENLADNGGVHVALAAMRKSLQENPEQNKALPRLDTLSPEQLFFINFGRVWCSNMRPEMAVRAVRGDVHSPAKVRVNAAVQNSLDFAEAFKCGRRDKEMNPANKCSIW